MNIQPDNSIAQERQLCTFQVDSMLLGVDVRQVQEVIRFQEITPVPTAPGAVSGLINLRGRIVTAIDLRARLGLGRRQAGTKPMNVVVRTEEGGVVSLLVDEIGDVLPVGREHYERIPGTIEAGTRELLRGVYKLKDRLLLVLDTDRAAEIAA